MSKRHEDFIEAGIQYRMEHGRPMAISGGTWAEMAREMNRTKPFEAGCEHGFDTKEERQEYSKIDDVVEAMDYMLAKHIDCRNMIEDDSALEAQEGMYSN